MNTRTTATSDREHAAVIAFQPFPPLAQESRTAVPTEAAAFHLNRQPQTLRAWACLENGPIRPIRVNGRLAWKVADLRALLGEVAQ